MFARYTQRVLLADGTRQQKMLWNDMRTADTKERVRNNFPVFGRQIVGDRRQLKNDLDSYNDNATLSRFGNKDFAMPALRRILKYTPAVVLGMLVVAWVASFFGQTEICVPIQFGEKTWWCGIIVGRGSASFGYTTLESDAFRWQRWELSRLVCDYLGIGFFGYSENFASLDIPLPCFVTAVLPLAIAPFLSFRFRVWHYLAYTALVAVELAYYLRWQE